MCVCVDREGERERGVGGRERTVSFPRPVYPKIHLSVLQTVCVRIFRFMIGLFSLFCFFLRMYHQSVKTKKRQRTIFLSYIFQEQCELTFSIKQTHYKTGTLWHSYAFILVTLRLLKSRLLVQKSFWIKDRTKFLQKQCSVCAAFADGDMSFLERLTSGRSLFPWSLPFSLGSVQSLATDRFVYKPAICEDG